MTMRQGRCVGIFSQNSRFQEFWTIWKICFVYIICFTTSFYEEISFLRIKKWEELTYVSGAASPASSLELQPRNPPSRPWEFPVNAPLLFQVREQEIQVVSGTLPSLLICYDLALRSLGHGFCISG